MYFALDPERSGRQDELAAWVADHVSEAQLRAEMADAGSFDREAWRQLGAELAAVGHGGACDMSGRGGLVDAVSVLEVLAAALYPGPCLGATVVASVLADAAGDEHAAGYRAALRRGDLVLAAVWARSPGDHVRATGVGGDAVTIDAEIAVTVDAAAAERILISDGEDWFDVATEASGLEVTPLRGFDQTRRLSALRLRTAPARRLRTERPGADVLGQARLVERIAVAAEDCAVARHCLDAGVDYASERQQFGRPIGAFQSLQHWFTDIALAVECAWSATYQAAWDVDQRRADASRSSYLAAATAGEAALAAAEQFMQVGGGVGFTWDNPAHLYLKRAKGNRLLFGHPDTHRAELGELLGI